MPQTILIKNLRAVAQFSDYLKNTATEIRIRGNAIESIGSNLPSENAIVIDGKNCVALPGLVNTHHHFYQTLTRAIPRMQNVKLFPWLVDHYRVWEGIDEEAVYYGTLTAMSELLLTGCTLTTDHHYLFPRSASPQLIDIQFKAAQDLGMRFVATRGSMSYGESKGGLPPDSVVQDEKTILTDSQRLIETFHDSSEFAMQRVALAPCSPFSVSEASMVETARLARAYRVRLHTHLAETLDEEKFCLEKFGCRPVKLMERLQWIGPDVWFAHCVHLNRDEINLFAESGTGIAHCPSSNMRLGSGIAPIRALLDAGARVGLAVDGSASNDSSDMLGEARQALLLQRVAKGADALTAAETFQLATRYGAQILGFDRIGALEPGFAADIALFSLDDIGFAGIHDPIGGLLFAGHNHRVHTLIVNGNIVVKNGRLSNLDESRIATKTNEISANLLEKAAHRTGIDYLSFKLQ